MREKIKRKLFAGWLAILVSVQCMGCGVIAPAPTSSPTFTATAVPTQTPTPTRTPIPTRTPVPTATVTLTPFPTSTATIPPVPTVSVDLSSGVSMARQCRAIVDGLYTLRKDLGLPERFMSENPSRQPSDFDPNRYFQVFKHLKMRPGYQLDFLYFSDELGGLPLVYARKTGSIPYASYTDFLKLFGEEMSGERSYDHLRHAYDYLEKIQIDSSPDSYFEFTALAFQGNQFYLWWHGLYNDLKILCEPEDIQRVYESLKEFDVEIPQDVKDRIAQIDFSPVVIVGANEVTIRMVTFTKWGGFFENVYVMDKKSPGNLIDVQFNRLIEYDCGISF